MKKLIAKTMLAAGALALLIPAAQAERSKWPKSFAVGTASQGGSYFSYGSGWANLVAETLNVSGGAEVTGGPVQNMALVHTGKLAMGMTTLGPAQDALEGRSPLAPGLKMTNVCALFPMYQTPFSLVALKSSGIKKVADIPVDSKIGFGPAGSTADTYFPKMVETLGIKFERRNGGWSDLSNQLREGQINVIAFAAGVPVPAVSQLESQADINIIEFSEAEQKKITDMYPVSSFSIKPLTYKSQKNEVRSVAMWNFAIANCELDTDFVYNVMKTILDNNEKMVSIHKASQSTLKENWDKNTFMPFHPGAVKYYEERGIKIPPDLKKM